jgi:hypothetical protein
MRLAARAAALSALTLALAGPALSAHAATNHWKTMATMGGGKVQACKVATTETGPWKIRLRVDATKAHSKITGSAFVSKDGTATDAHWRSGVAAGHISKVGTLKLPRGSAYRLGVGISTGQAGNGGEFKAGQIRGC